MASFLENNCSGVLPIIFSWSRKIYLKKKLEGLKLDLKKTLELIKSLQKECFVQHKINTDTYHDRVVNYEERIAEIKHSQPIIKARLERKSFSYLGLITKPFKKKNTTPNEKKILSKKRDNKSKIKTESKIKNNTKRSKNKKNKARKKQKKSKK